jgi:cell volume regulation protein A
MTPIVTMCALLLIAYLFDLTSSKTKIPSVILLLFLGWIVHQLATLFGFRILPLESLLPVLGTIGLILIVLEGSLELEWQPDRKKIVIQSFAIAVIAILAQAIIMGLLIMGFGYGSFGKGVVNMLPLCVISSAVAIPTVRAMVATTKEFVIYESSFSDIIGILLFNFLALSTGIGVHSFLLFIGQVLLMMLVSFAGTLALAFLLRRIDHHIKFVPIILMIILIYEVTKEYELPSLIFIVFFGLFLGNLDKLRKFKYIRKWQINGIDKEIHRFKELSVEAAFLVRASFFILFGYLIKNSEILNTQSLVWALATVAVIFGVRAALLKWLKKPLQPLFYIAPRGLITILLFLSIPVSKQIPAIVNKSLIIQVIILSTLLMMFGMMRKPAGKVKEEPVGKENGDILPNADETTYSQLTN